MPGDIAGAGKAPATTAEAKDTDRCLVAASLRRAVDGEGRRGSDDEHSDRRHEQEAVPSEARREMGHTDLDVGHKALVPGVPPRPEPQSAQKRCFPSKGGSAGTTVSSPPAVRGARITTGDPFHVHGGGVRGPGSGVGEGLRVPRWR